MSTIDRDNSAAVYADDRLVEALNRLAEALGVWRWYFAPNGSDGWYFSADHFLPRMSALGPVFRHETSADEIADLVLERLQAATEAASRKEGQE